MENYNLALPAGRCLSANDDISSIIKQIRKLLSELRDRGIDDGDIIGLLSGKAKNARVRLGPDRMLVLADENPIKIKLTPVESTLYKLVLKYPDGINADELWKYREELSDIYGNMTVYDDMENILNIIENICDEEYLRRRQGRMVHEYIQDKKKDNRQVRQTVRRKIYYKKMQ